MTRTQYFDFRAPDSTSLLNDRLRGILQSGVYLGYNAAAGTGLNFSLLMDTDPDNTGQSLGKLITPDGVAIEEDADLVDEALGFAGDGTFERIDFLVATYVYNASLPNNQVTYQVIQGTAGSPPVPPVLTDDQVLLSTITMPIGSTLASQATISDANRKNLFADQPINLEDVLKNGVYRGFWLVEGTLANRITLKAGTVFTKQETRINEAADQVDKFTIANTTSAAFVRRDTVVMLHKFEDIESNPPDYIVVAGTEVDESAGSAAAVLPTDPDLLAAATAFDPKYTSADHITKLGFVRAQGIFSASFFQEFTHPERLFPEFGLRVRGTGFYPDQDTGLSQTCPWPFTGPEGLLSALDLIETFQQDFWDTRAGAGLGEDLMSPQKAPQQPLPIYVEGTFRFGPTQDVVVPEWTTIEGIGQARFIFAADDWPNVVLGGMTGSASLTIQDAAGSVPQAGVPVGLERYEVDASAAMAAAGLSTFPGGISSLRLRGSDGDDAADNFLGNRVFLETPGGLIELFYEEPTTTIIADGDDTFRVIGATGLGTTVSGIIIMKRRTGLKNVTIELDGTVTIANDGGLHMQGCEGAEVDQVVAPSYIDGANIACDVGRLDIDQTNWATTVAFPNTSNTYGHVRLRPQVASAVSTVGAVTDRGNKFGTFEADGVVTAGIAHTLTFDGEENSFGELRVRKFLTGDITLDLDNSTIGVLSVQDDADTTAGLSDLNITGNSNVILKTVVKADTSSGFTFTFTGVSNLVSHLILTNINITFATDAARANFLLQITAVQGDEDRNLILSSDGTVSWDLATSTLSWSADIDLLLPYQVGGRNRIRVTESPAVLADGDVLFISMFRGATGAVNIAPAVKAAADLDELRNETNGDTLIIARRFNETLYFFGGTLLEDGQTLGLGTNPPPDNSVTRDKMTDSAWEYVNLFADDFFEDSPTQDFPNVLAFRNSGTASFTYTIGTGVIQYGSSVDLSSVLAGDTFLTNDGDRFRVLSVDDGSNNLTLDTGLVVSTTATGDFDGAVVRGNIVLRNSGLSTFAYSDSTGVIQYGSTVDLSHVSVGYLFRDSGDNLFEIGVVNDGGNSITLATDLVVDNTPPTADTEGSIETNNNPRNLPLNDLRMPIGLEEIIWTHEVFDRGVSAKYVQYQASQVPPKWWRYFEWEDRRVATKDLQGVLNNEQGLTQDSFSVPRDNPDNGCNVRSIELTAYMTDAIFSITEEAGGSLFPTFRVKVDGKELTGSGLPSGMGTLVNQPTGGTDHRPIAQGLTTAHAIRLPAGVHTVEIFDTKGFADSEWPTIPVARVWLLAQPIDQVGQFFDTPGRYWKAAKSRDLAYDSTISSAPVSTRGGRIVRFIPDSDPTTRLWSNTAIPIFSTPGDTNSNTTISSVSDTTGFKEGDLIRVEGGGNTELHCIAVIPTSSTLTTQTAVGFTQASSTVTLVGSTLPNVLNLRDLDINSELQMGYTVGDFIDDRNEVPAVNFVSALGSDGSEGWDQSSYVQGDSTVSILAGDLDSATRNPPGGEWIIPNSGTDDLRIGFTGSGLQVQLNTEFDIGLFTWQGTTARLFVNGCDCGVFTVGKSNDSVTPDGQLGPEWYTVCSDLSYGFHTVILRNTGVSFDLRMLGYRTLQPKTPSVVGRIISASNAVGDVQTLPVVPGSPVSIARMAEGFIQQSPWMVHKGDSASWTVSDSEVAAGDVRARGSYYEEVTGALPIYMWFYGSTLTLVLRSDSGGGVATNVTFLDKGGSFVAPSAMTGFTVTGADTIDNAGSGEVIRQTWDLGEYALHAVSLSNATGFNGTTVKAIVAIEVDTPYHQASRLNSFRQSGILNMVNTYKDARKTKPLKNGFKVNSGYYEIPFISLASGLQEFTFPVPISSRGGLIRISAMIELQINNAGDVSGKAFIGNIIEDAPEHPRIEFGLSTLPIPIGQLEAIVRLPRGVWPLVFLFTKNGAVSSWSINWGRVHWEEVGYQPESEYLLEDEAHAPFLGR